MSAPAPSSRRLAIAIGTAATSATLAIGVTAASLLGWFRPAEPIAPASEISAPATPAPAASPVILVPVTPTPAPLPAPDMGGEVQLAMDVGERGNDPRFDDDRDRRDDEDDEDEDEDDDRGEHHDRDRRGDDR